MCTGTSHRPHSVVASVQHSVKHSQTLAHNMTVDRTVLQRHSVTSHLPTSSQYPPLPFTYPNLLPYLPTSVRPLIPSCLLPSYFHSQFLSPFPAEGHSATAHFLLWMSIFVVGRVTLYQAMLPLLIIVIPPAADSDICPLPTLGARIAQSV